MNDKKKLKTKLQSIQKAFEAYAQNKAIEDVIPDEWFSREEYQNAHGISEAHSLRQIQSLLKVGKAEKKTFSKKCSDGVCRKVPHYRIIN
jgi:Fic family protein